MIYTIPTPDGTKQHWVVSFKLDGVELVCDYKWNPRAEFWTIDIATSVGEDLVTGQVVKPGKNLLARSNSPSKPPGYLECVWGDGGSEIPGLKDFAEASCYIIYDDEEIA